MAVNYKQLYAKKKANEQRIKKVRPDVPECSGIYLLTRYEDGFKYAYVGQAKNLLSRLADHLSGFQHIDLSIKKHGLFSTDNPTGWRIQFQEFPVEQLDEQERRLIKLYADNGFQLRNKTAGGQDTGKSGIADNRPNKGYYDGLAQGRKNLAKELRHILDLHLTVGVKKDNKVTQKALDKFWALLNEAEGEEDERQ